VCECGCLTDFPTSEIINLTKVWGGKKSQQKVNWSEACRMIRQAWAHNLFRFTLGRVDGCC
jgi:hypothetical protein